jgi:hypothetical protein
MHGPAVMLIATDGKAGSADGLSTQ